MAIGCTTLDQTIEVIVRLAISIAFNSHVNTTNDQKQQWNSHANARQNCKNHWYVLWRCISIAQNKCPENEKNHALNDIPTEWIEMFTMWCSLISSRIHRLFVQTRY